MLKVQTWLLGSALIVHLASWLVCSCIGICGPVWWHPCVCSSMYCLLLHVGLQRSSGWTRLPGAVMSELTEDLEASCCADWATSVCHHTSSVYLPDKFCVLEAVCVTEIITSWISWISFADLCTQHGVSSDTMKGVVCG